MVASRRVRSDGCLRRRGPGSAAHRSGGVSAAALPNVARVGPRNAGLGLVGRLPLRSRPLGPESSSRGRHRRGVDADGGGLAQQRLVDHPSAAASHGPCLRCRGVCALSSRGGSHRADLRHRVRGQRVGRRSGDARRVFRPGRPRVGADRGWGRQSPLPSRGKGRAGVGRALGRPGSDRPLCGQG